MGQDFKVTVYGERGEEFKQVFGTNTVHVLMPFPQMATMAGGPEESVYMLDVDMLTDEQHDRLVTHLARKFSSSEVEIRRYLHQDGLSIRASDTVVTIENPQKWLLDDAPDADLLERMANEMDIDPDDSEEFEVMSDLDDVEDELYSESYDDFDF